MFIDAAKLRQELLSAQLLRADRKNRISSIVCHHSPPAHSLHTQA
jgi:hypothetical protein